MPAFVINLQHLVWSTDQRQSLIDPLWQDRLYGYFGGIISNHQSVLLAAGGMPDHVHLLVSLHSTISITNIVSTLKSNSTRWIHQEFPRLRHFCWQEKYGSFSVSKSQQQKVVDYIHGQAEHHRQRTFQEEFLELLKRYQLTYDERYVWQ